LYLGIDLGTSGVKLLLVAEDQRPIAQASTPLEVQRPRPLWSEQDPESWWQATCAAIQQLRRSHPRELATLKGIGLSGQMHGATLLDDRDRVLRPAILWNDGRSAEACAELERRVPAITAITGNAVMPGFTAPKLVWLAKHEPETFARVTRVLLPKDYLRLRLSGDHASEMSDAAGTLWLDVSGRTWSEELLEATGLSTRAMPRLYEGSQATGRLRADLAEEWGMPSSVAIAGGAGDNAAGAVGVGVVEPGQALLSLGTSGVYFTASDAFAPNPASGVHAFCHCLPERWHQMSVILSAASCVGWVARVSGAADERSLLAEIEESGDGGTDAPLFLPYLSGERTPHNDPHAQGVFFGLTHDTDRADLGRAVLEGVAFAFADGQDALLEAGTAIESVVVIGGGARSRYWGRILASALERPLAYTAGGEVGPAFGAARLARLAASGESVERVCTPAPIDDVIEPDPELALRCRERRQRYRDLYEALRERFPRPG
jgi:xylulokinase